MANRLPPIPLDIVERIQNCMSYKGATRSACLCTQLYQSWYRRKNIELDERHFTNSLLFWNVGLQTIRRYQDAELQLEKFIIRIVSAAERDQFSAAVIEGAAKVGAIEITIILQDAGVAYRIPHGVFQSESLVMLNVIGGALRLDEEIPVTCSSLKFLSLLPAAYVDVANDMHNNYLLKFPSLLSLKCRGFLLRHRITGRMRNIHNLQSLCVETLSREDHFWITCLILMLPSLKLLVIRNLPDCINLLIRSDSLEMIYFEERRSPIVAALLVPQIKSFQYIGIPSSRIVFNPCLGGAVCSITVDTHPHVDKWFSELHTMLKYLACSKINLSVTSLSSDPIPMDDAVQQLDRIEIEELGITYVATQCPAMLENLLCVCRPTRIIHRPD